MLWSISLPGTMHGCRRKNWRSRLQNSQFRIRRVRVLPFREESCGVSCLPARSSVNPICFCLTNRPTIWMWKRSRGSKNSSPGIAERACSLRTTVIFSTGSRPGSLSWTTENFSPAKVPMPIFSPQRRSANMPKIRRKPAARVFYAGRSTGSAVRRKRVCAGIWDA